jgi:hypothetical protein
VTPERVVTALRAAAESPALTVGPSYCAAPRTVLREAADLIEAQQVAGDALVDTLRDWHPRFKPGEQNCGICAPIQAWEALKEER